MVVQSTTHLGSLQHGQAGKIIAGHEALRSDALRADSATEAVCSCCGLPVGEVAYIDKKSSRSRVHGECMAQLLMHDLRIAEESRLAKERLEKQDKRKKYNIGWDAKMAPSNLLFADKLQNELDPQGMCCISWEPSSVGSCATVGIDCTHEPRASVNLEYLAIALRCRIVEGREPLFSLDPSDMKNPSKDGLMQLKRYEPSWLCETSAAEVLFQADYHLKELSMGEAPQPVIGMKSCFDYSALEGKLQDWNGREWFTVRNAEVLLSADGVLIPEVSLGVEAREQILGQDGLEDARVTRPDHPLVLYAEDFTRKMALITARRSAVFHLREFSKAAVLAKFLVETNAEVEELLDMTAGPCTIPRCLEVPQLWCDHFFSQLVLTDGRVLPAEKTEGTSLHSVYGGVDLGLESFMLFGGAPVQARPAPSWAAFSAGLESAFQPRPAADQLQTTRLFAEHFARTAVVPVPEYRQLGPLPEPTRPVRARRPQAGVALRPSEGTARRPGRRPRRAAPPPADAQGVDLDLDAFNLSAPSNLCPASVRKNIGVGEGCHPSAALEGEAAFNAVLKAAMAEVSDPSKHVLAAVFSPHLCDRRQEGGSFIPPDTSETSMEVLRQLVEEEDVLRAKRKEHFESEEFSVDDPGLLFPAQWKSSLAMAATGASAALHRRPDLLPRASCWKQELQQAGAIFERRTEDGSCLRVYRVSDVEVRSWQESTGDEEIVAVFAPRPPADAAADLNDVTVHINDHTDHIVKASEYVERVFMSDEISAPSVQWFTVLVTSSGAQLLAELPHGGCARIGRCKALADRLSLAKVLRCTPTTHCPSVATVLSVVASQETTAHATEFQRRDFAHRIYDMAIGAQAPDWTVPSASRSHHETIAAGQRERRICPTDGTAYTFEELLQVYQRDYTYEEIMEYWEQCPGVPAGLILEPVAHRPVFA
mmetsp:Transcript_44988/g.106858  ORF Transcript_44988/g.106858 Transcript_44988/m.106858 type:complete len:935 (+) Transcript_44988:36-2840(+)